MWHLMGSGKCQPDNKPDEINKKNEAVDKSYICCKFVMNKAWINDCQSCELCVICGHIIRCARHKSRGDKLVKDDTVSM